MNFLKFIILNIALISVTYAQYSSTIRTGRPGQSIGPHSVGKEILQLQSGYTYEDLDDSTKSNLNNVIRYGFAERTEARVMIDQSALRAGGETTEGTERFNLGLRRQVYNKPNRMIKTIGLQLENGFALNNNFDDEKDNQTFIGVVSFLDHYTFNYVSNFEAWNKHLNERFILNYGDNFTKKLSWFFEGYVDKDGADIQTNINYEFGYVVKKDFALDISAGNDIDTREYRFISIGFSVRNK